MTTRFFYLDVVLKRQYAHYSTRSTMKVTVKSLSFFVSRKGLSVTQQSFSCSFVSTRHLPLYLRPSRSMLGLQGKLPIHFLISFLYGECAKFFSSLCIQQICSCQYFDLVQCYRWSRTLSQKQDRPLNREQAVFYSGIICRFRRCFCTHDIFRRVHHSTEMRDRSYERGQIHRLNY